ncbi:MAG: ABC transporter permease [Christensenellales bacterium]|jgi:ribose transport system permease protein
MWLNRFKGVSAKDFVLQNAVYILSVLLLIVPGFFSDTYLTSASITVLLKNISLWGMMAIGVSFVMLIGCNDLSVGFNTSMLTVITVLLSQNLPVVVFLPLVLLCGIVSGLLNGFVVADLKLNPFIATLSTQMIFRGIGLVLSNGVPIMNTNEFIKVFFEFEIIDLGIFTLTLPMVILIACLIITSYVLKYTQFGQNLYVVGGNKEAAQFSGISIRKITYQSYAISGLFAAITAILVTSFNTSGNPVIGERYSLQTVAACVLGGLRVTGGYGNTVRAVLGVVSMQLIQKVLYMVDSSIANLQIGIVGVILIIFLIIDMISTEASKKKAIKPVR